MIISRATAGQLGELLPLVEEFHAIGGHEWDAGLSRPLQGYLSGAAPPEVIAAG